MNRLFLPAFLLTVSLGAVAHAEELELEAPASLLDALPGKLSFDFHGYYRTRFVTMSNVPVGRLDRAGSVASDTHTGRDDASDANYFTSRLRLEPSILFGDEGKAPKVAVYSQFDLLDTVVWGDNARRAKVPVFAGNPTNTGSDGLERPSVHLRRLWLELAIPVGQLRVGRQGSQGGLGLLFNDGNGFRNDFGDADAGTTFDRVMFATRPLTIVNALTKGDKSETPLIFIVGHDRLVQDPLGYGSNANAAETRLNGGPFGFVSDQPCGDALDPDGTKPTTKCDNSVSQWSTGLIWNDKNLNLRQATDELTLGAIYVNRAQQYTRSRLHIFDAFWRFKMGLTKNGPSLLTEGEAYAIRGRTSGLKVISGGVFDDNTGLADQEITGDILNYAGRVGLTTPVWDGVFELGHSGGDEQLVGGDGHFKMYPWHADYRMGLLMYPVALHARSYNTMAGRASDALHGGGGVFNSTYLNLKGRYRIQKPTYQVEFVGQGIVAWADTLNGGRVFGFTADYYAPRDVDNPWADNECKLFESACALGWEVDLAVRFKWLPREVPGAGPTDRYMVHWSNEFGLMQAGRALEPRLAQGAGTLWTAQSRIAFMW